jgi:uncharacterized protein
VLKERLEPYLEFVRPFYANRDSAHDFRHIQRIVGRLDLLSQEVPRSPQKSKLYFLASFHGLIFPLRQDEPFRQQVRAFLYELNWTAIEIEQAFESLERHLKNPQTIEEEIICDANSLELLGAFGIAKAFTTGGARGQSYEETVEIFEN